MAGEIDGVEKARAKVRELMPLVFTFELPILPVTSSGSNFNLANDPYLRSMQDQYNIQIMFKQTHGKVPTTVVVVKGCESESAGVKEATLVCRL